VQLATAARKLEQVGVETVAVVATDPQRARLYFRLRPPGIPVGADPDLVTHGAYGVPREPVTAEAWGAIEASAVDLLRELRVPVPATDAHHVLDRLDGFQSAESDAREAERHQLQFTAQFLVDREGVVRWTNVECAREGLAGIDRFPSDEELLQAADALPR
jgi:hypothetical protein